MDWQTPLNVHNVREIGKGLVVGSEAASHALMGDVSTARDVWMLMNGQACPNCWTTFPARPSAVTLKEFEPYLHTWVVEPIFSRETVITRICYGVCLLCQCPMDYGSTQRFISDLRAATAS